MADKKKIIGLCAALAAVVILIVLLLRGCGGNRVAEPTDPAQLGGETSAAETQSEGETTESTEETAEETEETTESTEETEETEPEETQSSSSGSSTPGGYNPGFGSDDDDDDDDDDKEEETFTAPAAGAENNPYVENLAEVPGQVDTVMIPLEGTVCYEIHGAANSVLVLDNADASLICGETTLPPDESGRITLPIGTEAEPVTIQLSNVGAAEAVYQLRFLGAPGSESNPEVLGSIAEIPVELAAEDADGHYYVWTADQNGELTLAPQVEGYEIRVTIGDTTITNADSEEGKLIFEIEKEQEVTIQVIAIPDENGAYPAITDTILGAIEALGTVLNPYERTLTEIPAELTTVEIAPAQVAHYHIYGAGETVMTVEDPNVIVMYGDQTVTPDENGVLTLSIGAEEPAKLEIRCTGEEAKAYTLHFDYPEGSRQNPIALEALDPVTATLTGGEDSERWYSWTAEQAGTVTFTVDAVTPETVTCGISLTTGEAAAAEELAQSASAQVEAGQSVLIRVETAADEAGLYPAAEITISGEFTPKPGTEENPLALNVPEDTVAAGAGESIYCTVQAPGADMALTGEAVSVTYGETEYEPENGQIVIRLGDEETARMVITNKAEADAEYTLTFTYPLGTERNPVALILGENSYEAAEESNGCHFSWTADVDGELTIAAAEGTVWTYTIEDLTNAEAEAVTGSELSQMVEVTAGDELRICIEAEGQLTFTASFYDPTLGTEANPIWMNVPEDTLTVPAGETIYYQARVGGMILTLAGENVTLSHNGLDYASENGQIVLTCAQTDPFTPPVFAVTNTGEAEAAYAVSFVWPEGHRENPLPLEIGDMTCTVEAGTEGCFYTWTAEADGTLTFTMAEDTGWTICINNMTTGNYGDLWTSDDEAPVLSVSVTAGDEIQIVVNTYESGSAAAPAGNVEFTAEFQKTEA